MYNLAVLFAWFIVYSFIGWFYECIVLSIEQKRIINTGFLIMPICPIYGFGALFCLVCLWSQHRASVFLLFIGTGTLCCILEYFVSWLMEKTLKARWWDYSNYKFNINGRVCLWGFLAFGLLCTCLLKFIHPFVRGVVFAIPKLVLFICGAVIFIAIIVDLIATLKTISSLQHKLALVQIAIDNEKEKSKQKLEAIIQGIQEKASGFKDKFDGYTFELKEKTTNLPSVDLTEKIKSFLDNRKFSEKRILRAFPNMKAIRYREAVEKIKLYKRKNKK